VTCGCPIAAGDGHDFPRLIIYPYFKQIALGKTTRARVNRKDNTIT